MTQTWNIGNVIGMQIKISLVAGRLCNSANKVEDVSEVTRNLFAYGLILFLRQKRGGERRRKKEKKNPNFYHMFSKYSRLRRRSQALSAECGESKTHQKQSPV